MAGERGPLDPQRSGQVALTRPLAGPQSVEHQPGGDRPARAGERAVEGPADRLGRLRELQPDRHAARPQLPAHELIVCQLIVSNLTQLEFRGGPPPALAALAT